MSLKLICTRRVLYKIKVPAKGGGFTVQTIFHSNTTFINYALILILTFGLKKKRKEKVALRGDLFNKEATGERHTGCDGVFRG